MKKKTTKEKIKFCIYSVMTIISPTLSTKYQLYEHTGRWANLNEPKSFSEKISWLKLNCYANDPTAQMCADKYSVREYVKDKGFEDMLNPLYGVYDKPDEIQWDELPESFVLKWNFGCGYNIVCRDKKDLDTKATVRQLRSWGHSHYWNYHAELQYKHIKKKIICERFLELDYGTPLVDYKFYTFNGTVKAILAISRVEQDAEAAVFMTPDWQCLSDIPQRYACTFEPEKPKSLERMIEAAEKLAAPFPFVRVDFYEWHGQPIFGEMTFTPAAGIFPSETEIDGKSMGEYLQLS